MVDASSTSGLRARILNAGMWTSAGHMVETVIRLGTSLVMTRLLVPGDFGLMALAISIPASLAMLSDVGMRANVITKSSSLGQNFLWTAWTLQVLRGLLLALVLLAIASLLLLPQIRQHLPEGSLLLHPKLPWLLAAMAALPPLGGFESVNLFQQERDINFRPLILRTIISKTLPVPVMVIWAYLYPSVWSLVAGALAAQAVLTISSHVMVPGTPMKFRWDRLHARDLLNDGKWTTLASATTFIVYQGDRLILAGLLSATQMGLYAIALALAEVARSFLQQLNGYITLPLLTELIRTRPERAIEAYYKYRRPIDIIAFTGTGFLWIASPEIIQCLYDHRYSGAGWILQVLSLSLASFPFQMTNTFFIANNEWRSSSVFAIWQTISFFFGASIGYSLGGATGVIWAIALYNWPPVLFMLGRAYRRGWADPLREFAMLPFVLVGLALGFVGEITLLWIETMVL